MNFLVKMKIIITIIKNPLRERIKDKINDAKPKKRK